jgi:lipopolysaccharide/colanic/teichoic acid biosynthesis glycosyltransferase
LFDILKFRTMYVDRGDTTGVKQTVDGDARVTPLGRFMRQRSLDELPQLLNVLFGTMSLVGPRPHVAGQLAAGRPCAEVIHYYELRHAMKPGLTGWAQVNGYRGPTDTITKAQARVDHDLAYIQNFTVLLDLKIIWRTFWKEVVTGSGS